MRANLLDELDKPYVMTARAKGLSEWRVVIGCYPRAAGLQSADQHSRLVPAQLFFGQLLHRGNP